MSQRFFGARVPRNEDARLLTGRAMFVDDVHLPGMLHAAFVRSDLAHGIIRKIDISRALELPGVVAVYTAETLGDFWQRGPLLVPPPPIEDLEFHARTQVLLARRKVRHVGEAIAVVVAEDPYVAEDAAEIVFVEIDPLDVANDPEGALAEDAPLVHDDLGSNLAAHVIQRKGDYGVAHRQAEVVLSRRLRYDRGIAGAIENRGVVAHWDAHAGQLTLWDTTQAPIPIRNGLAGMLGLSESQVQVIAPFIGGGFGPKIMMFYPDEVLIPWISMQLERPVKWIEDRFENFFSTTQERGQVHDAEIAMTADGRILGIKDTFVHDTGAYDPYGLTVPINSQCTLLGPYAVPNYLSEFRVAFTNRPIVTPVRGAGRQHGVFVMERLLDLAARELGIDRTEIRRRNFLTPEEFPHHHEILYQDFAPLVYDSGDYEPALDKAIELIGYETTGGEGSVVGEPRPSIEEPAPKDETRVATEAPLRGTGIVSYVEGTGVGPYEGARVTVELSGKICLVTGIGTQGQGHFTSFAQIVADSLGVEPSDVRVVTGDTKEFHWGTGTFASRGAVVAGNASHAAAQQVREKVLRGASEVLEAEPEDLELAEGRVLVRGAPDVSIGLGELAALSNPLRGAVAPGTEPGLEAYCYFGADRATTASGMHAMTVLVDPETALITIERYAVVHDCGRVINPTIVEGQIHGGVAHGIGNAFYEELVFDDDGQLRNASLMDYLLPTSTDVPSIDTAHMETPSPLNPLGTKGVGEAGAIPVGPLFAQAIEDALSEYAPSLEILDMPLSPSRLFEMIHEAREAAVDERPADASPGGKAAGDP